MHFGLETPPSQTMVCAGQTRTCNAQPAWSNHRSAEMNAPRLCPRRRGAKPRGREGAARRLRRLLREQLHVNSQNGGSNDWLPHQKAPRESGRLVRGADWLAWRGRISAATSPSNTTSARLFPDSGTGKGAIVAARQTLTQPFSAALSSATSQRSASMCRRARASPRLRASSTTS
jgi:hypothetical protein